jgi:CheY-like chemotaxis protein
LELFQQIRRHPDRIGVSGIDLVIADWEMTQIDGAALLRWIRRHPKSPDSFLPFIAMSSEPSRDQVRAARDLGASQFIARPITIEVLCDQLVSLTGKTRNFIKTRNYFGPDRRHHDVAVEVDLRCDNPAGRPGVRHLIAPNRLATKLGGRFAPEPERLAEAQKKLDTWKHEFVVTIQDYLARAESNLAVIEKNHDSAARHRELANLNRISHQIQSDGRNFGFPLVNTLARSLHQLTCQIEQIDRDFLELVRAHLDALQAVLSIGLRKDGGKIGRKLIQELFRANRKFVRGDPDEILTGSG